MTDGWLMDQFDADRLTNCPTCRGSGVVADWEGAAVECARCSGTGCVVAPEPAGPAPLPAGIHPCPTCDRAGCERCDALGRGSWMRVYADRTDDGRATLELWFGAAGTQERVALTDHSLAHDRVDSILATLAEAHGVVIRDRRGR